MKMITSIINIIGLFAVLFTSSCKEEQSFVSTKPTNPERTLIVYLSRTNNTKVIAEIIQQNVGGTLVALELETPYPEDYRTTVNQVANENATGFLPAFKTVVDSMQNYDIVFIGFPTWGMQLPPPIKSFLYQYDLSGKKVIPFNTNGGYGIGSSFQTVKDLCPNSEILDGFTIRGGSETNGIMLAITGNRRTEAETEVRSWLSRIAIIQKSE